MPTVPHPPPRTGLRFCDRLGFCLVASLGAVFLFACGAGAQSESPPETSPLDRELIRTRCEAVHPMVDQAILFGHVIDGWTGTALPGGKVYLSWARIHGVADSTVQTVEAEAADGAYIFCDVPQRTRLVTWADALGHVGEPVELWIETGETTRRDLAVVFRRASGSVAGRVLDASSGDPIEAATLRILPADASAITDRAGSFRIPDLPSGRYEVTLGHVAYGEPKLIVEVSEGRTTHIEIKLTPQPIAVEPIDVTVSSRPQWLESNGFYRRQNRSLGQFVSPEQISRQPWRRFSQVLQTVPGVEVYRVCRPHCEQIIRMAGTSRTGCRPEFYVDGRRLVFRELQIDVDALAPGGDLAAVEVYRNIAETPPQFFGLCGSVVIWTKRGGG